MVGIHYDQCKPGMQSNWLGNLVKTYHNHRNREHFVCNLTLLIHKLHNYLMAWHWNTLYKL